MRPRHGTKIETKREDLVARNEIAISRQLAENSRS